MTDSRPLLIRGLIFDGNSQNQEPYQQYEEEHSDLLFLMGDLSQPGRLKAIIEDCIFQNGVADGISVFHNVDVEVYNCSAENVFRGGFVCTGGYTNIIINNFTTKGSIDRTGIDLEVSSKGYGNTCRVNVILENINIIDGDFDLGVGDGSVIIGNNIKANTPFNLYALNSKVTINNSEFAIGPKDRIIHPYDVTFNNCTFYASEEKISEGDNILIAAPSVAWNLSKTAYENQKLTFNDCLFTTSANVEASDTVYGISTGCDPVAYNNVLTVNGGQFSDTLDVGIKTQYRGGNWKINDATINADLAFYWTGYSPSGGNEYVDIVIDGARINGSQFMFAGDYTPAGSNLNKLEIRNVYLNATTAYISSPYGLRGTQYLGNSVIVGEDAPTDLIHGFVGDIYTDNVSQWKCIKAGYFSNKTGKNVASEWIKIN